MKRGDIVRPTHTRTVLGPAAADGRREQREILPGETLGLVLDDPVPASPAVRNDDWELVRVMLLDTFEEIRSFTWRWEVVTDLGDRNEPSSDSSV